MSSRSWSSRFALWAAVFALLLKAGVPMAAAMAASLQGVATAEVCPVYGVALPGPADGHAHHHHHHDHGVHASNDGSGPKEDHSRHELAAHGDHCALTALAAFAGPDDVAVSVAPAARFTAALPPRHTESVPDACALWVARMKHGPPASA
ncbi:hypothetical protein [Piscinibacter terrae]|uniref:DUF2946 domain-containing protein n=1 Tax=Piscinibacter terrae TaxID=2496871 RepID=A0A3N7IUQ0_9BURK|nr:hypothetical protein [Albitalea terrae]RQP22562.1 hypothetical protein DZC73_23380 [Albitalea terrae]